MSKSSHAATLVVFSREDLRDYAQGRLDKADAKDIETLLLEDDRARQILRNLCRRAQLWSLTAADASLLRECVVASLSLARAYASIGAASVSDTIRKFASGRASVRLDALGPLAAMLGVDEKPSGPGLQDQSGVPNDLGLSRISEAKEKDREIWAKHEKLYLRPLSPEWKTLLADWISMLRNDADRVVWLSSAFKPAS